MSDFFKLNVRQATDLLPNTVSHEYFNVVFLNDVGWFIFWVHLSVICGYFLKQPFNLFIKLLSPYVRVFSHIIFSYYLEYFNRLIGNVWWFFFENLDIISLTIMESPSELIKTYPSKRVVLKWLKNKFSINSS